jgi:hypothetical protein
MSRSPHPSWFNHPNNTRWRTQAMKFIIMQFSLRSVFIPFRSIYLPHHSVLRQHQSQSEKLSFAPIQHNFQNYNFVCFNL